MSQAEMDDAAQPVRQPLGPWGFIVLALACSAISYVDRQVISLMVGPLKAAMRLSDAEIGLLQGLAFSLCYAVGALPLAFLIDTGNRVRIASACVAVWSLATGACGLATSYLGFLLARAGTALSEAAFSPAVLSIVPDIFARNRIARATAVYLLGPSIGTGLALTGGGWLLGHFERQGGLVLPIAGQLQPWQSVFVCLTAPGLILALLLLMLAREPQRRQVHRANGGSARPDSRWGLVEIWRTGFLLPYMAGTTLIMTTQFALSAWAPTYFVRHFAMQSHAVGQMLGPVFIISNVAGAVVTGIIGGGGRPERAMQRVIAVVLSGAVFVGPCAVAMTFAPSVAAAVAFYAAAGFFGSLVATLATTPIQLSVPNAVRAQAIAIGGFILAVIGGGGGPYFVGAISDYVFHDEAAVGQSVAVVSAIASLAGVVSLFVARAIILRRARAAERSGA